MMEEKNMNIEAQYNWNRLKEKLEEVENTFLGLKTPIGRFICDKNGDVSEAKIRELTDRVIEKDCYVGGEYVGMSGVRKRYYELLFYLILRAYDPDKTVFYFDEFLKKAREISKVYKCREELLLRETYRIGFELPKPYFESIRNSCKILTGKLITTDMTKEELDEIEQIYRQKRDAYYKKKHEIENVYVVDEKVLKHVREKYSEYGIEGDYDLYDAIQKEICMRNGLDIPEEVRLEMKKQEEMTVFDKQDNRYLTAEEVKEWRDTETLRKEKWINSFENPQEYLEAYKEFSEIMACIDVFSDELGHNFENALLSVLEEEEVNKIYDDEKLLRLMGSLDKSLRISRI